MVDLTLWFRVSRTGAPFLCYFVQTPDCNVSLVSSQTASISLVIALGSSLEEQVVWDQDQASRIIEAIFLPQYNPKFVNGSALIPASLGRYCEAKIREDQSRKNANPGEDQ